MIEPYTLAVRAVDSGVLLTASFIKSFRKAHKNFSKQNQHGKCKRDSDSWHRRLKAQQQALQTWARDWANELHVLDEDDYQVVFDEETYTSWISSLESVRLNCEEVASLLQQHVRTRDSDVTYESWQSWSRQTLTGRSFDHEEAIKIAMVLSRKRDLSRAISDLECSMKDLENCCRDARNRLPSLGSKDHEFVSQHIRAILAMRKQSNEFTRFLTSLYEQCGTQPDRYGIFLREPDAQGSAECLRDRTFLHLEMLAVEPGSLEESHLRRISIPFPFDKGDHDDTALALDALSGKLKAKRVVEEARWNAKYPAPSRWASTLIDRNLRISLQQAVSHGPVGKMMDFSEKTLAALSLTNWLLLLWSTPWAREICSCSVARHCSEGDLHLVLTKVRGHCLGSCHTEVISDRNLAVSFDDARGNSDALAIEERCKVRRSLLCLGLALSELALPRPVEIHSIQWKVITYQVAGKQISEAELLDEIDKQTLPEFMDAVKWCFDFSRSTYVRPFQPEDILGFASSTIKYLEKCHKYALNETIASGSGIRIYQNNKAMNNSRNHYGDVKYSYKFNIGRQSMSSTPRKLTQEQFDEVPPVKDLPIRLQYTEETENDGWYPA